MIIKGFTNLNLSLNIGVFHHQKELFNKRNDMTMKVWMQRKKTSLYKTRCFY